MRAVHQRGTTLTPRGGELLRRARLAHELAGRVLEPPEPLPSGNGDAIACDLYRQSVVWSLAAYQERGMVRAQAAAEKQPGVGPGSDLGALWDAAGPSLLAKANSSDVGKLRGELVGRSFQDFAELEAAEQARLARALRVFADNLTTALDTSQKELDRIWLRRVVRVAALLIAVAALILLVSKTKTWSESGTDLAIDAEWSASSLYADGPGCPAPEQECAASPSYFVHTEEQDNPWVMFDLKQPKTLSAVRVENRLDCCYERAIPLIVELSDDAKTWKEVAQRTSDFSSWKTEFPSAKARYVRLRIPKRTNLHLSRVRLLP